MLTVLTWKWRAPPGYRSQFTSRHVNVLRSMVDRHYRLPHRFVCVTDDPVGIDADITIVPIWSEWGDLPNRSVRGGPSCYRRLRAFAPGAHEWIGGRRFVSLDLDVVMTRDVVPLWSRTEEFVAWGDTHPRAWYNGSMWLLTSGARSQVWERFDPATSPQEAMAAKRLGSDQGWISHVLGPNEATWGTKDGVYSYRVHMLARPDQLPDNARVVVFHGKVDPWDSEAQRHAWVREHWK